LTGTFRLLPGKHFVVRLDFHLVQLPLKRDACHGFLRLLKVLSAGWLKKLTILEAGRASAMCTQRISAGLQIAD